MSFIYFSRTLEVFRFNWGAIYHVHVTRNCVENETKFGKGAKAGKVDDVLDNGKCEEQIKAKLPPADTRYQGTTSSSASSKSFFVVPPLRQEEPRTSRSTRRGGTRPTT